MKRPETITEIVSAVKMRRLPSRRSAFRGLTARDALRCSGPPHPLGFDGLGRFGSGICLLTAASGRPPRDKGALNGRPFSLPDLAERLSVAEALLRLRLEAREDAEALAFCRACDGAVGDFLLRPHPGARRVVAHGPAREETIFDGLPQQ